MARRTRSRPVALDLQALPEGWRKHDGTGCPVDLDSKPAVMFRRGTCMQAGLYVARRWSAHGEDRTWWSWSGDAWDIVAYKPG